MRRWYMRRLIWLLAAGCLGCEGAVPQPPGWQVLFRDDFEDGDADGWVERSAPPGAAWTVEKEGTNHVLSGEGHAFIQLGSGSWKDYRLRARVKVIAGTVHLNYRLGYCSRYFIGFLTDSLYLSRTLACDVHANLTGVSESHAPGQWYELEIVGIGPAVKVYVNGVLKIDFSDPDPVLVGGIGFETLENSHAHIDDVEISGPPELGGFFWVKAGGPLGGIGYDVRMRPDNPGVLFVTDTNSGINTSSDGGRTWQTSNRGIATRAGPSGDAIPIFCLTIDPNNPDTVWAGTQNVRGVYKSTDGGKTWTSKDRGIVEKNGITFRGFTVDPRDSRTVYAAAEISSSVWAGEYRLGKQFDLTKGVLYKTTDGGENWQAIWRGDNLARYVWIDPRNTSVLYVSTGIFDREAANSDPARNLPGGIGVLKSTDRGATWRVLHKGLNSLYIGSLFMHPRNPDVLLAGAGHATYEEGNGVYLSTDGGETWQGTLTGASHDWPFDRISAVEFASSDPRIAYAAGCGGFYRSEDGGRQWRLVAGGGQDLMATWGAPGMLVGQPIDIQVDPRNPDRLFVNSYGGGNFLSEDGGHTWANASRGYTGAILNDIALDPADPLRVYTVGRSGVFRSPDGGGAWEGLNYVPRNIRDWGFPGPWPFGDWYAVAVDPGNPARVLFADEIHGLLFLSSDRGRDWKIVFRHPGVDGEKFENKQGFKALAFSPSNPRAIYAGMSHCRGYLELGKADPSFGIFKSTDGGLTWREANDARTAAQNVNMLAVDPRSEDAVYAATLRGGIFRTLDGGRSWQPLNMGLRSLDVRALAIDPRNTSVLYAGIENGGVYKTTDAGGRWEVSSTGMDPQAAIRDIVIDPANPQILYAADLHTGVYRSENGGKLWVQINMGLSTRAVKALVISSDGGTLYAATEGEGVFRLDLKASAETTVAAVSAASFAKDAPLAPESIASLFGQGLAAATQQAAATPLPTLLADVSVSVTDSAGVDRWAPLFFASPGQINCQIPAGTATGTTTVRVFRQNRVVARGQVRIEPVAPALFTANSDGKGAPAAVALRVAAEGTQTQLPVFQCGAAAGSCAPAPIGLGAESDQVILLLFGTGIRGEKSVSVRIGGIDAPVLGASAQAQFVGLDQVNVRLPRDLRGRGEVELTLAVEGRAANTVTLRFQ